MPTPLTVLLNNISLILHPSSVFRRNTSSKNEGKEERDVKCRIGEVRLGETKSTEGRGVRQGESKNQMSS
jgi:hypothetical protein